jgi:hypothetical protein
LAVRTFDTPASGKAAANQSRSSWPQSSSFAIFASSFLLPAL